MLNNGGTSFETSNPQFLQNLDEFFISQPHLGHFSVCKSNSFLISFTHESILKGFDVVYLIE